MRRTEEEEEDEEFVIATKRVKSNKSASALRAVSRLKEEEEFVMATKRLKSNKSATALRAVSRLKKKILNVRDSFMDEFKLYKTIIKVYMHIASKISVVIQRLSHV